MSEAKKRNPDIVCVVYLYRSLVSRLSSRVLLFSCSLVLSFSPPPYDIVRVPGSSIAWLHGAVMVPL